MKNGPDMWCRVVGRQVKLHGDAFPEAVSVFEDAISRNIASQNRHRIHFDVRKVNPEPALQARRESLHESFLQLFGTQRTAGCVPDFALHRRQMADVLREKIDLGASRFAVGSIAAHFISA